MKAFFARQEIKRLTKEEHDLQTRLVALRAQRAELGGLAATKTANPKVLLKVEETIEHLKEVLKKRSLAISPDGQKVNVSLDVVHA
ncbi:hypothetical protein NFJ02_29g69200 [Pycnococcus provasolii]|mmetsp:Transcript_11138/g.25220  ORF Transcript_11138/g.25220 Transcript_11138/m.25220 type:complete len:86 (+) Transcript_11138:107-364(+)|eukprot:CAMPEP_0198708174 /NCGR_PEP_ID=MMETSP1471-20131121/894_1 /TAXON_ID=41880 /ORGANISM="Pycnococcus provasolii, Strain RCC733" /LENGTH=85 /DNA_ID=CAMNT_0044467377 /DNA_START=70 /DNA_END=327 /DNA_ORIENTATION=-